MEKSKLNEFCQRNGWGLPMYSCIKDGQDHNPHFRGSVFVNGVTFVSENVARSSKAAQNEAAKLALSHFLEEKGEQRAMDKSKLNEFSKRNGWGLPMYSCTKEGQDHNPNFRGSVFVNGLTFVSENIAKSSKAAYNEAAKLALSHFLDEEIGTKKVPNMDSCNSEVNEGTSSEGADFSSPTLATPDLSAIAITGCEPKTASESHLLGNRVRVYTSVPDVDSTNGTIVLPISDDRWAVVSLDFPNEISA